MPVHWYSTAPLGADGEEAMGRYETAARIRSEAAIRSFHVAPSWRRLWLAVKWAFLSGWRSDDERVYVVDFAAGASAPVVRIDVRS